MQPTDEDRFAEFVHAHSAALFRTAYLLTGDHQRAEDLVQTTLVRVYQLGREWPPWSIPGPMRDGCW
jgi:DNA-directed RNA polymerase specialized sigma24 family protein